MPQTHNIYTVQAGEKIRYKSDLLYQDFKIVLAGARSLEVELKGDRGRGVHLGHGPLVPHFPQELRGQGAVHWVRDCEGEEGRRERERDSED